MPLAMAPALDDGVSHDIVEWLISPSSFSGHAIIVQYPKDIAYNRQGQSTKILILF